MPSEEEHRADGILFSAAEKKEAVIDRLMVTHFS